MNAQYATESPELVKSKGGFDCFINSCGPNLRNPLTSIEGLVRIAECFANEAEVSFCLNIIEHCASTMLQMIRNIEDYSVMQNRELSMTSIQGYKLVAQVVNGYRKEIEEQQLEVTADISQSSPWISDEPCNYLILKHLIGNAINFSASEKESKRIVINLVVTPKEVSLEVSDNGIGISEEEKGKIFEPFHRSSNQSKGSGLGLFLVRGATRRLNAVVNVISDESIGTSFRISMPNHEEA